MFKMMHCNDIINTRWTIMRNTIPCTLRLEEGIYTRIKEIARSRGTSFTAFVRAALADVLKQEEQKTLYDAFTLVRRLGGIGEGDLQQINCAVRLVLEIG
jgi:hypothetical protein